MLLTLVLPEPAQRSLDDMSPEEVVSQAEEIVRGASSAPDTV